MSLIKVLLALGSVAVTGTGTYLTYDYLNKKEESTTEKDASDAPREDSETEPPSDPKTNTQRTDQVV